MSTILINALPGVVPEGFCPSGENAEQQRYELYLSLTQFSLAAGQSFYNKGNVLPTPENRVYPWFRQVGGYPDRWYQFAGGLWLSKHPLPTGFTALAPASITSQAMLDVWDEGEAGAVSLYTGPFWEIDADFEGRSPMGPGAIPSSNPSKTLSVSETYGEGAHSMTSQEVGPHTHPLNAESSIKDGDNVAVVGTGGGQFGLLAYNQGGFNGTRITPLSVLANTFTSGQQAMPVIHPVRGRYFIKRSARIFYKV